MKVAYTSTLRLVALTALLLMLFVFHPATGAALDAGQIKQSIRMTRGDDDSLRLELNDRQVILRNGSFKLNGQEYKVERTQTIYIPPCPVLRTTGESFVLSSPDEKKPYYTRMPLKCLAGGKGRGPVTGLIIDGTLSVKHGNETLVLGKDYKIDRSVDAIDRLPTCRLPEGSVVKLDYSVYLRRIDSLTIDAEGTAHLMCGPLSQFAPVPPPTPEGLIALANIFAPKMDQPIEPTDVFPIWDRDVDDPVIVDIDENAVDGTKAKLAAGKSVTVAFLGDSVTDGCFATRDENAFPQLFMTRLRERYPKAQIKSVKLALGGSTSSMMFSRFYKEVLPSKPDLIVVEFVNDLGLSRKAIERNYTNFFKRTKATGADVIVCLPHTVNPKLHNLDNWLTIGSLPYYDILRNLAPTYKVALANVGGRWQNSRYEGLSPALLLSDNMNHPNDRGHEIYAEELMKLFK